MKLVVGNFKMNMSYQDILDYLDKLKNKDVIYCPPSIYSKMFIDRGLQVGLQNIYTKDFGSYTGEISAYQAKSMGITYTIIGHSERRIYFNEDDKLINEKVINAKDYLKIILCVGETKEERQNKETLEIIKKQLLADLSNVQNLNNIIIAYEPKWAIGAKQTPSNLEIAKVVNYIKSFIKEKYKTDIKVLYGGSVNASDILRLEEIESIDGYLVGNSSIDYLEFSKIIEVALKK